MIMTPDDTPVLPTGTAPRNPAEEVARAVQRHWQIVVLIALAATLVAWIVAATQPKRYRAVAVAGVIPLLRQMSPAEVLRGVDSLDRRVVISTVAALASTATTMAQAGAARDDHIDAAVLPMTSLFSITVEGSDAKHVAAVANAVPRALDAQTRGMFLVYGVSLASPATPPAKAALPRVERALMAGFVAGLLGGVAVAWLIDRRRTAAPR